jgi:hypothetical protein
MTKKIQCNLCGEMVVATSYHIAKHRYEDMEAEADILATKLAQFDMAMASMDPKFREEFKKVLSEITKAWKGVPEDERALLVRILMEPKLDTQVANPGGEGLASPT